MLPKPSSPCGTCLGNSWPDKGFVPASGTGANGVLLVMEAAGENEAREGMPAVGKAGYYLFQNLQRVGISREDFRVHNVLSCRPPNNFLAKAPYELEVIQHCSPLLDATIFDMQERCKANGKTFVIWTLGRVAFKRIMGLTDKSPILREDYLNYVFWQPAYRAYVLASDHPSYLMRGNNHLLPVLQFGAKRALEIAEHGFTYTIPDYLLDPNPSTFSQWVQDYLKYLAAHPEAPLSYDIETPYKQGKSEEKVAREDDDDYTILRCSFAYIPGQAISVPWNASYKPYLEEIFASPGDKCGWNNSGYDSKRVRVQMPINGNEIDGMLAWHVLNSALPKSLGFVTPFYAQSAEMWKHLSDSQPAFYNAKDADMALVNYLGIRGDLSTTDLGKVFDRHVIQLNRVLSYMSGKGVLRDEVLRRDSEVRLSHMLDEVEASMVESVPQEARKFQVYKKTPKVVEGLIQVEQVAQVKRCSICGLLSPKKAHFKAVSAKRRKLGEDNVCEDADVVSSQETVTRWAKPLEWKVSKVGLSSYQKALRHQAIINRREHKVTFDEDAIKQLIKRYPKDTLYPSILKHRELTKLIGTYIGVTNPVTGQVIGGMPMGRDGRGHPEFTHNPSTLRLACPFFHTLPRAKQADDLQTIIRNLIIASPGSLLFEADFSAIEAVLVGYFAGLPDYIRLSKMGIHSYLASHVLGRPADLKWSDEDLKAYFLSIKKSKEQDVQDIYNGCKRAIHLSGYGGTPKKMHTSEPDVFKTVKDAERLQGIYFDLFPAVKKWQFSCQLQADKDGFLRNPFSYIHRFYRVFTYKKEGGKWVRGQGDDQNRVLAFLPQSTAAGIIKEAMLRLYFDRFEEAGQYMRLQVHDSLVSDVPLEKVEEVKAVMEEEMSRPVPELRLPASFGMGDYLSIGVESKQGPRWGELR